MIVALSYRSPMDMQEDSVDRVGPRNTPHFRTPSAMLGHRLTYETRRYRLNLWCQAEIIQNLQETAIPED